MPIEEFAGEGKGRTGRLNFCILFGLSTGAVHIYTGFPWCAGDYLDDRCFTVGTVFVGKDKCSLLWEGITVGAFGVIAAP